MQTTRENLHLEVAVLASLALHVAMLGCVQYRAALAGFPLFRPLARIMSAALAPPNYTPPAPAPQTITFVEVARREPPRPEPEPPRQFMETDDSQVTGEQPKDAKYYSDRSTVAANPENPTGKNGETPYLTGKETRVMSTEDVVPNPGASPSVPAAPPMPPVPPPAAAQPQPETPVKPGPMSPASAAAAAEPPKEVPEKGLNAEEKQFAMVTRQEAASEPRPALPEPSPLAQPQMVRAAEPGSPGTGSQREIASIKSHLSASGVSRIGVSAFGVEESPFGAYDKQIIRAVQSRWYALIDKYGIYERTGEVTIMFDLYTDGQIGPLKHVRNTAGELLALFCEKAISESAPFERLSDRLQVLVGEKPREVNFTFYY